MVQTKAPRSPDLSDVLRASMDHRLARMRIMLPGQIVKYDAAKQTADIQPTLMDTVVAADGSEITTTLPQLNDVPIIFPRSKTFFISFPLEPGDQVTLFFSERSLDKFLTDTSADKVPVIDPVDLRRNNISDAVAYPGLYPFSKAVDNASTTAMVIGSDEGMRIEISDAKATFTDDTTTQSVAIAEKLEALYNSLKTAFNGHTHLGGALTAPAGTAGGLVTGASDAPSTTVGDWDPDIASDKVKIPGN